LKGKGLWGNPTKERLKTPRAAAKTRKLQDLQRQSLARSAIETTSLIVSPCAFFFSLSFLVIGFFLALPMPNAITTLE
jgi:hypothetical protein